MYIEQINSKLAISEIEPIDFTKREIQAAWQSFISHAKKPHLKEILEIRTFIQRTIQDELESRGFLHPPSHMFSTCVDPLNHETETAKFNYYGQECSLMQSLIFHKMAMLALTDLSHVYWVSPNIRKELGVTNTKRYATEFTQIDFESTELEMATCIDLIEQITKVVFNRLYDEKKELIERISGAEFYRLDEALQRFDAEEEAARRGIAVGKIEAILASELDRPFILTNLKREAYDRRDDLTGKYQNYDLCLPVIGEILSGAEREFEAERLKLRMEELGYPLDYFAPILKLATEHGLTTSAGAGFGVERFVRGILRLDDLADVYPFKRVPEEAIIF